MITFFRKHLHSKFYKIILWITFLSLGIVVGLPTLFKSTSSTWIARINGHTIEQNEFVRRIETKQAQLDLTRYQFEQMGIPFDLSMLRISPEQWAFKSLIEDALLDQVARNLHIALDEEYVAYRLSDPYYMMQELSEFISPFAAMNMREMTSEALSRVLRSKNLTIADFEHFVEKDLERKVIKDIVTTSAYVPIFELRDKFIQDFVSKKFSAAVFSLDDIYKEVKKQALSQEEVRNYFDSQNSSANRYMVPEKRSGKVWEFSPEHYGIKVSDNDINEYYNTNKMKYQEKPAQLKVRHILFKIADASQSADVMQKAAAVRQELVKSPDLFAAKAEELSQDSSAKKGGLIEYFAKGELNNSAFEKAAFALKADGEISPIVQTAAGLEIIQRVDRKPAQFKKLHTVHHEIKEQLIKQKFGNHFSQDADTISQDTIHNFAREKHAHEKDITDVQLTSDAINQKLFKLKTKGDVGYIKLDNKGYVIQLTHTQKSYMPTFESVRDRVEHDIYMNKAKTALTARLNAAKTAIKSKKLEDVVLEFHGSINHLGWIKSEDTKHIQQLTKEGLPVAHMMQLQTKGATVSNITEHHAYLVQLEEMGTFDESLFNEKKAELYKDLQQRNSSLVAAGFVASLTRDATLVTNEKAIQTSEDDLER